MGNSLKVLSGFVFLILAACGSQDRGTVSSTASAGIIGGTAVGPQGPINFSTVQILHPSVTRDTQGHLMVSGLSTCTGTLVAPDIILTAGHCSASNPKQLLLVFSNEVPSDLKKFFSTLEQNPQVRRVVAGVSAPNWEHLSADTTQNWGDISLLRFTGALPDGYVPARLIPSQLSLSAQQPVILAGFGELDGVNRTRATELMQVAVNIADPNYSETEMQIDNSGGRGACHGDSGGPAYVTVDGKLYLAGVTSRADINSDPKAVCIGKSIYTKVQSYLSWMSAEIQKLDSDSSYGAVIAEPPGF